MKKFKAFLSVILAAAVLVCSAIPAFAVTEGETATADETSPTEMTREEINRAQNRLNYYANQIESDYVCYGRCEPSLAVPDWTDNSVEHLKNIINEVRKELFSYKTTQEFENGKAKIDEAVENLCMCSKYTFRELLVYLERDYNSTGFYDEDTYARLKTVYEDAQKVYNSYDSVTDREIHVSFINMRNMLDDLCSYNPICGDVNKDGSFNICDVTLMQLDLAEIEKLNNSQRFCANFDKGTKITDVTEWQLCLAEIEGYDYTERATNYQNKLNTLIENKGIDPNVPYWKDTKKWLDMEQINYMYYFDFYVNNFWDWVS